MMRVQLHPATDSWMRGDRYGTILRYGKTRRGVEVAYIRLDKSHKVVRVPRDLYEEI